MKINRLQPKLLPSQPKEPQNRGQLKRFEGRNLRMAREMALVTYGNLIVTVTLGLCSCSSMRILPFTIHPQPFTIHPQTAGSLEPSFWTQKTNRGRETNDSSTNMPCTLARTVRRSVVP